MNILYSWLSGIYIDEKENKRIDGKLNCFKYRLQFNSEQNFSEDDLKTIKQALDHTFTNVVNTINEAKRMMEGLEPERTVVQREILEIIRSVRYEN